MSRKLWIFVVAIGLALGMGRSAFAQDPSTEVLKARLDQQEKQIQAQWDIIQRLQAAPTSPMVGGPQSGVMMNSPATGAQLNQGEVSKIVGEVLNERDQKKKADDAAAKKKADDEGFKIGSETNMTVRWKDYGVWIETPHKDFVAHVGGWVQLENVFWNESPNLISTGKNPVGELEDGNFWRRLRLQLNGQVFDVFEYDFIYAFETTPNGVTSLDDFWMGAKDIPFIGTLRAGHFHTPTGLEGDQFSSSVGMTFLERSSMTDAFTANLGTGVLQSNAWFDQCVTFSSAFFRQDIGVNSGTFFGDGEYAAAGRLTCLPYYENDGRCLVHLGADVSWYHATRGGNETVDPQFVRLRARPEMRDSQGLYDGASHDGALLPGNAGRLVDTGNIQCDSKSVYDTEFLWIAGPFSVQAEYSWCAVNAAVINKKERGDLWFDGGYLQLSYFLTGENRTYDKRFGKLGRTGIASPNTPFWVVNDENGGFNWGIGAWEIAARWSHLNLNNAEGPVLGGIMDGLTLGVNWYLNNNF
ncbi:MAG TPA: porin, partial [Gemmataceae bacterium]|nr:porin [Gemmataceae bacterium]